MKLNHLHNSDDDTVLTHADDDLDEELIDVEEVNVDDFMLTTIDNPHNPKTDYDKWQMWDQDHGYNTESYIARLLLMEEDFDLDDDIKVDNLTNKVILDILEHDVLNVYTLV